MTNLSTEDLKELLSLLRTSPSAPTNVDTPRIGSTNPTGAWTGFGTDGKFGAPRSSNCMRAFRADPLKSHTALSSIETKCVAGLSEQTDLLFCMKDEPNAHKFVASIRALEEAFTLVGMEGVFAIIRPDGTTLNMLREPGRLTSSIVDDWILALETGVPSFDPVSKLAKPNLPVCPYDKINMRWSGSAILNSCSEALKMDLKDLVPLSEQTGPKLFFHLLQKLYRPSQSKIRVLRNNLEALTLTAYPAENVSLFCHDASKIVREITMNFTKEDEVPDLTTSALKGLTSASDLLLCAKVRELRIANDVSGFTGAFGKTPVNAITALQEIEDLYDVLVSQSDYAPARAAPSSRNGAASFQALHQECSGAPTSDDSQVTCWSCKKLGHRVGSPKCENHVADDKWTDADNIAIKDLIKAKNQTLPDRKLIPDSAEYSVMYKNVIVAKYCRHCGRFVRGSNAHYTPGHKGSYKFAYRPNPTGAGDAAAGTPAATPAPAPAPATPAEAPIAAGNLGFVAAANLCDAAPIVVSSPLPATGPSVPTISANQFASRGADYSLGSVTIPEDNDISSLIAWMGKD